VVLGVVESCAIYPLFLSLAVVLYFLKTNALALITGPMTQVVAIVPTLMWIQVILGRSQYDRAAKVARSTPGPTVGTHISFKGSGFSTATRPDGDGEGMPNVTTMSELRGERNLESQRSAISIKSPGAGAENFS